MSTALALNNSQQLAPAVEQALIGGDLSRLTSAERLSLYRAVCDSLGLNPLTKPFAYLQLNGKLTLYALKDCTEQLRKRDNISLGISSRELADGVYVVTARAQRPDGRVDESIGAVPVDNLKGEAKANAMMKAETKSKRRVTLSICGLGMLDESEVDSIPDARRISFDEIDTGGHPFGTQAALDYVRDSKLAAIRHETSGGSPTPEPRGATTPDVIDRGGVPPSAAPVEIPDPEVEKLWKRGASSRAKMKAICEELRQDFIELMGSEGDYQYRHMLGVPTPEHFAKVSDWRNSVKRMVLYLRNLKAEAAGPVYEATDEDLPSFDLAAHSGRFPEVGK